MKVNQLKDFVERVGWTAVYFAAAAFITWATSGDPWSWRTFAVGVGLSVCKVVVAQQFGSRGSGDAIPGGVEK